MDIQPSDLRYFFEAARTLNISRAAERLNIGQPALSQAIQRLESILGTKVFDRYKTGVQLTAAGRRLLQEGRPAIETWDRLKSAARSADEGIEGTYCIGCHTAVGLYTLPSFLGRLLRDHAALEISLRHGLSREVLEDVVSFRTDFGLVMNPVPHPDLVIRKLCEDRVSFWKSANAPEEILLFDPSLAQSQTLVRKAASKKRFNRYVHSSSLELIAALSEAGCGSAVLPERIARRHPKLSLLDPELPVVRDQLCLIYRADRRWSAAARLIIDTIVRAKI